MIALIPASERICDKTGASGRIPVKHLADSNGSRYIREDLRDCRGRIHRSSAHTAAEDLTGKLLLAARIVNLGILLSLFQMQTQRISLQVQLDSIPILILILLIPCEMQEQSSLHHENPFQLVVFQPFKFKPFLPQRLDPFQKMLRDALSWAEKRNPRGIGVKILPTDPPC